ncbi:MAG: cysteine desulfurase NifS [Ruminiclostridium sp.]|nr:cysteine desulfurase NifS [Ruminiclostridium sp.]
MLKTRIYLDNAATTKVSDKVLDAMLPYFKEGYGNPSSIYTLGREAAIAVNNARKQAATALGCEENEIFFTSCGSESDNWAIKGTAKMMAAKGKKHIITSVFEHHAVLHPLKALEKEGFEVTYLPVYENGIVKAEDVANAIRPDTALVTIMYANNEIGTIQPIAEIGAICKEKGVIFHTDAVQAIGNVHINVKEQNIDMLSLSGHKIHAQKGCGILYINKKYRLPNLIDGGAQERNRRAGTENVPAIVGLGVALTEACNNIDKKNAKLKPLQDKIYDAVMKIDRVHLNGDRDKRMVSNLNFSFEGVEGESLLLQLDLQGIAASSGSACTSGSLDPSHVLLSIGLPHEIAHGSLRISMSEYTTEEEVDALLQVLPEIITKLRGMSPLWEHIIKGETFKIK